MDHAIARLGSTPVSGFQADLTIQGEVAEPGDIYLILPTIFPNLPYGPDLTVEVLYDDAPIHYLIPVPQEVANEVLAGVDFGWTEVVETEDDGELIVSVFIPGAPV